MLARDNERGCRMQNEFRDKIVTVTHCTSRSDKSKVADFNWERTMPVWAAVQACWVLGAFQWDSGDCGANRVSATKNFVQKIWICEDSESDLAGWNIPDNEADIFWSMVEQF